MSVVLVRQNSRTDHIRTLHQERCACKTAWDLAKKILQAYELGQSQVYVLGEVKSMSMSVTSKKSEEKIIVIERNFKLRRDGHSKGSETLVLTAVHDLSQFVPVQLLENTPGVLSLGKLCIDHGYSCEWVRGQEPRLTQNGKSIICKTDNFVPLVVPGLSVNSENISSSTTPPQSLRPESPRTYGSQRTTSSSSNSVSERSDETSSGKLGRNV